MPGADAVAASRPPEERGTLRRRALRAAPFLLLALIAVVLVAGGVGHYVSLEALRTRRAALAAFVAGRPTQSLAVYIFAYVAVIALSLPGALIMTLAGGFLFGPWLGGGAAVVGVTLGALVMFLAARSALGEVLVARAKPDGLLSKLEAQVRENAFSYLLTLRLTPAAPVAVVNLVASLVRMRLSTYLAATVLGVIPSSFVYAFVGAGLGEVFDQGGRASLRLLIRPELIAALVGLAVLSLAPHLNRLRRFWSAARRGDWKPEASVSTSARASPTRPTFRWKGRSRPMGPRPRRFSWPGGLSARLLLLTALFVLAVELIMLVPSLASFEQDWLVGRVRDAELASLAVEASPAGVVGDRMAGELLQGAGVVSVAVGSDGVRRLLLQAPRLKRTPELIDLRHVTPLDWIGAPIATLTASPSRVLRVVGRPQFRGGDFIEILVPEAPLKSELTAYMLRLLGVSVVVSAVAGMIVYFALNAFLVRPMQRITTAMERFRARPEDPAARIPPSGRKDEIGRAEAELDRMQDDLRTALQSRARLAALGEAVAKINHDLRNMLASARIVAERLAGLNDPRVTRALPRLERALDRAIALAQDVLAYGRSEEPPPQPRNLPLAAAALAAGEDAGLPGAFALELAVPDGLEAFADPDQLHRMLVNLFRNAREALEDAGRSDGRVRVEADAAGGGTRIRVIDNGPGVPERARERLFQPFAGSGRAGGAGLGLAITRELARAHGGDVELVETGPEGTTFEIRLPPAPV